MGPRIKNLICFCSLLLFGILGGAAQAAWPEKEVTLICPWPPGGSSDLITRSLAQALGKQLPKPVVVVNRDGANGVIATTEAKQARADGYTILQGASGLFITQPLTQANLGYKLEDFELFIGLTNEPILLMVHAESPYRTVEELVAAAKKENRVVRFANSGSGGIPALTGLYFFQMAGVRAQPIPFKGGGPAITALLGKHVDAGVAHPGEGIPHSKRETSGLS